MNVPQAVEITFTRWATSKWTMGIARACMILTPVLLVFFGFIWNAVQTDAARKVGSVQTDVTAVQALTASRASDGEAFQTEVRGAIAGIDQDTSKLKSDLFDVKVDVGVIRRLVTELRENSKVADVGGTSRTRTWSVEP